MGDLNRDRSPVWGGGDIHACKHGFGSRGIVTVKTIQSSELYSLCFASHLNLAFACPHVRTTRSGVKPSCQGQVLPCLGASCFVPSSLVSASVLAQFRSFSRVIQSLCCCSCVFFAFRFASHAQGSRPGPGEIATTRWAE